MATTTELLALDTREVALLWVPDGIEFAWTNNADLVGYSTGSGHTVRQGLQLDGLTIKLAIDLRSGQFMDCPATVTLVDFGGDGELAALFAAVSDDQRQLGDVPFGTGTPVHPLSDLTGRPELDEMNIGLERIGANGARHQYAVPPGFDIGIEHSITTPALDLEGAPVSAGPLVWTGRRWALYMIVRDHIIYPDRTAGLASWRPFSEARLLSFGTMADQATVNGNAISLELEGPDSLLRKSLAVGFHPVPVPCTGDITLVTSGEEREDGMFVQLFRTGNGNGSYGISNFATFITGVTVDQIRDDLIGEINATAAATGVDGVWNEQAGFSVGMTEDGSVHITLLPSAVSGDKECGTLVVVLHRKVWSALGYDVDAQASLWPDDDDERAVLFSSANNEAFIFPPGPDYWVGRFRSAPSAADAYDGDNLQSRTYRPLYVGGTTVLLAGLNSGRGQVIRLQDSTLGGGASGTSVAHPGQLAWPVASLPGDPTSPIEIDGTPCDRCGWWLFLGKRRYAGTEEIYDERWVGLASWTNGGAQQDGLVAGDAIIVTHWMDPTLYGYTTKGGVDSDWIARSDSIPAEGQIQAIPIAMLGYHSAPDLAHIVLRRLLNSTGTAVGWDAPEQDSPEFTGGDNEPAGVDDGIWRDAEIAALGLAIPDEWIDPLPSWNNAIATIENASILDVKNTFIAGHQAMDVVRSLMQPAGLAWNLRGGRFGIWCPSDPLTYADATVSLSRGPNGRAEAHANAGQVRLSQDLRKWQPIDLWKVSADWQPFERKATNVFDRQAPDPAYRYRPGEVVQSVMAHGMRGGGSGLTERLLAMSRWAALRHFEVRDYPVHAVVPGLDIWPGTVARLTDPELWTPDGTLGVTNRIAIVTATGRTYSQGQRGEVSQDMTISLLVLGSRSATPRLNAPIARGIGYDAATSRLYVADDYFNFGNGWADAQRFDEPAYDGITPFGGDAAIVCLQWDGNTWATTMTATVTSVVTTAGSAYLQLDNESGTYYRDMDTFVVLRPSTVANAAWVEALFGPIADDTGVWVDDAAADQNYIPWET